MIRECSVFLILGKDNHGYMSKEVLVLWKGKSNAPDCILWFCNKDNSYWNTHYNEIVSKTITITYGIMLTN